jgi:Ca2+-binding EF-hand superfamily protein
VIPRCLSLIALACLLVAAPQAGATPKSGGVQVQASGKQGGANGKQGGAKRSTWKARSRSTAQKLLRLADKNADGSVGILELQRFVGWRVLRRVEQRVPKLDRNGDGRVTRAEVPGMATKRFARFDADGDGAFTVREVARHMRREANRRCLVMLAKLDRDGNGVLSLADVAQPEPLRMASGD